MVYDLIVHIFEESHNLRYSIYSGATKMQCDLREVYRLNGMKKYIAGIAAKCPNFQQVKAKH